MLPRREICYFHYIARWVVGTPEFWSGLERVSCEWGLDSAKLALGGVLESDLHGLRVAERRAGPMLSHPCICI